jgi:hypothetical protein
MPKAINIFRRNQIFYFLMIITYSPNEIKSISNLVKILCWSFCVAPAKNPFKSTKDVTTEVSLNHTYNFFCIFELTPFEKIKKHTHFLS